MLPVHGFVLAGGKSRRMGMDKATLRFRGLPLVEIAVEKLRGFCADVSIVGERDDLAGFAEVVRGERVDVGPGAGIEAGLRAARQDLAMFVPVDVPLVPGELLRKWGEEVLGGPQGLGVSFLLANRERHPSFCMVRRDCLGKLSRALDVGTRRLEDLLLTVDDNDGDSWLSVCAVENLMDGRAGDVGLWFSNLNTLGEFGEAELWAHDAAGGAAVDTTQG